MVSPRGGSISPSDADQPQQGSTCELTPSREEAILPLPTMACGNASVLWGQHSCNIMSRTTSDGIFAPHKASLNRAKSRVQTSTIVTGNQRDTWWLDMTSAYCKKCSPMSLPAVRVRHQL